MAPTPPELFTRWIQWGAFSPILRTHCKKNYDTYRRIWLYPTVSLFSTLTWSLNLSWRKCQITKACQVSPSICVCGLQYNYEIMRRFLILRASLVPYIYSNARVTYDEGLSLLRPLYYYYPEAPEAYSYDHQYMFGSDLLVAPVTQEMDPIYQMVTKEIWIPEVCPPLTPFISSQNM